MYHHQSGPVSRPPSPHRQRLINVPLALRTQINPAPSTPQQQRQSSSPPNNSQPKPISSEKFEKALKLYTKYCLEKGLAQQAAPHSAIEATNNLHIPLPARARSLTSRGTSRAYTPSISNSAYDGVTDISSVVSFDLKSPGSSTPNSHTELKNFNGQVVKQRIRRPLVPVSKAKAALIRHLGSCNLCSRRRVGCDPEHHDIASLEEARKAKARSRERAKSLQQTRSMISNSSQHVSRSTTQQAADNTMGQTNALFGIGETDEFQRTPSSDLASVDPQSPALIDYLSDIPSYLDRGRSANFELPNVDPYMAYQDGQMIALGVLRDLWHCAYRDGCQRTFEDAEALQTHFETHLHYNRIASAYCYMCLNCECMNNSPVGPCSNCATEGSIELRVYGRFIRIPTFQRNGFDGQDFLRNDSAPYFPSMDYGMGNLNLDFGLDDELGNGNYTGGVNEGNFFYQNDNSFEDLGSQGGDNAGNTTPRSGGYPFQGSSTRNRAKASPVVAQYGNLYPSFPGS